MKRDEPTLVLIEDHNGIGPVALIWNGRWLHAETITFIETGVRGVENDKFFKKLLYLQTNADLVSDPERYILIEENTETEPVLEPVGGAGPSPSPVQSLPLGCPAGYSICGDDLRTPSCFTWGMPPNYLTWDWLLWNYRGIMGGTRFWKKAGGTGCGPGDYNEQTYIKTITQKIEYKHGAGLDGLEWSTSVSGSESYSFSTTLGCNCCYWDHGDDWITQSCVCTNWQAKWRVSLTYWYRMGVQGWRFDGSITRIFMANNFVPVKCCDYCNCPM